MILDFPGLDVTGIPGKGVRLFCTGIHTMLNNPEK
mgnify:CR=1 FL=1